MANFRNIGTDYDADLRAPHYTNGRLLTAEDLQSDQRAVLERLAQVGKGAGFGIIDGYRVTAVSGKRDLRITAGIGINRRGDVVRLAADSIALPVQPISEEAAAMRRSGRFEACEGDEAAPTAALNDGAYLLTVAPLSRLEGSVPRYACDGAETATCANQWEVEGVEFKIIRLTGYTAPTGNRRDRNRNLLAHWFYGSAALDPLMHNPFEFAPVYNGFSKIAAADLSECDLPLAAFYWADNQISFVEEWATRRRLIHPYPASAWKANISDQRVAEGEARFVQFQTETADLQQRFGSKTGDVRAATHFAYLPPVGLLPINPYELILVDAFGASLSEEYERTIAKFKLSNSQVFNRVQTGVLGTSDQGVIFNLARFFGDYLPDDYTIVQEDEIHNRLHQSWVQPAIQLPAPSASPSAPVDRFFEFTLADRSSVAVTGENFRTVVDSIQPRTFMASSFSTAEAVDAAGTAGTAGVDAGLARSPASGDRRQRSRSIENTQRPVGPEERSRTGTSSTRLRTRRRMRSSRWSTSS